MGPPSRWIPTVVSGLIVGVIGAYIYAAGLQVSIALLAILPLAYLIFLCISGAARLHIRFVHRTWARGASLEKLLIEKSKSSFSFMTVTGRTSLHRADVEAAIKRQGVAHRCRFRFLLLHPRSPWLDEFCRAEGSNPQHTRTKIENTTRHLLLLRDDNRLDIEVRWCNEYPVWRVAVVDEEVAHVGYYDRGRKGYEGPRMVCPESQRGGLFVPFAAVFGRAWEAALDAESELGRV